MALQPPPLDQRHAAHLAQQVVQLLGCYLPEWDGVGLETDPSSGKETVVITDPQARALIAVFARYGELIVERLNRAPQKNLLAFLDLLGASLAPPQPARVPLSFRLAAGSTEPALVPAGTQVASTAAAADGAPVVFETERELFVTPARLATAIVHDPVQDTWRDLGPVVDGRVAGGLPAFLAETPLPHEFYIDIDPLRALAPFDYLTLMLEFDKAAETVPLELAWQAWDGQQGLPLEPTDSTSKMTQWGVFGFSNLAVPPRSTVAGASGTWLRCRLTQPVTDAQLPGAITFAELNVLTVRKGSAPEHACADAQVLDLGQAFFPFGERPRYGSAFYLASPLFGLATGTNIHTLAITVTDPKAYIVETPGLQTIPATRSRPTLAWESWDGEAWQPVPALEDGTDALTKSGSVTFQSLPFEKPAQRRSVNGLEGHWVRARITGGDYGREAVHQPVPDAKTGATSYTVTPATLVPPLIGRPTLETKIHTGALVRRVVTHNQLTHRVVAFADWSPKFRPFERLDGERPALYLGFELPDGGPGFAAAPVALYAAVAPSPAGSAAGPDALPPRIVWEARGAAGWAGFIVRDDTRACTRSGAIEWRPPDDLPATLVFGERPLRWIRARCTEGDWPSPPRLERLLLNTVPALQAETIADEVLGSSDGSKDQRYACSHAPVYAGSTLHVREPERPSALELDALRRGAGVAPLLLPDQGSEVWVPWHEVADFHASGPRDRHYVVDSLRGEVRFGDGSHGLAPPRGHANLRLARYRSGGGARGNLGPHSVTQLRTTLPYVDGVTHELAAGGGADAEAPASLLERAPRSLRHGDRAVTRDDVEDLARLASPEVARAKCVPLWNALTTPLFLDTDRDKLREPGHLTLIVVPRSRDAKPLPSGELVERVRSYLDARRAPTAALHIVGPRYVQVDVAAEVVPASLEASTGLEATVAHALAAFLHPLTGGFDGAGWPWGRRPHESDFHRCIGAVPGVDHVHSLNVTEQPEVQGLADTDHFLVHSGTHHIRLRPAGAAQD